MRLYALLFALAVCRTRAATIPIEAEKPQSNTPVDIKEPIEQNEINLRIAPDTIPVAIVEEPATALKVDENTNDYIPSDDEPTPIIKRLEIDLTDPGEPQRQQHDTQNPEFFERDSFVADIKQKLLETENVFKKSVSEVNESFENWVPNSQHLTAIQDDIKKMQKKFLAQLSDLNKSLQSYLNPQSTKSVIADPEAVSNLKQVESRLKDLEANFNVGVQTLSEGVKALEAAKADGDATPTEEKPSETGSPNPAPENPVSAQPTNPIGQVFQFFSDAIGNAINQMQSTINTLTNPNNQDTAASQPAGVQSDETATTSNPLNIFQQFFGNFGNFANFGQGGQTSDQTTQAPANSNPLLQVLSGGSAFFSNIFNSNRPTTTPSSVRVETYSDQPIKEAEAQAAPVQAENKPQASEPPKDTPAAQTGPIRQIIKNNPIVKGIAQRIQSITNPEKPRDKEPAKVPVKSEEVVETQASEEQEPISATKGHYGNNNSGNNNNVDGIDVKSVPTEEKVEAPAKEAELIKEVDEKETALPDKTE